MRIMKETLNCKVFRVSWRQYIPFVAHNLHISKQPARTMPLKKKGAQRTGTWAHVHLRVHAISKWGLSATIQFVKSIRVGVGTEKNMPNKDPGQNNFKERVRTFFLGGKRAFFGDLLHQGMKQRDSGPPIRPHNRHKSPHKGVISRKRAQFQEAYFLAAPIPFRIDESDHFLAIGMVFTTTPGCISERKKNVQLEDPGK